MKGVSDLFYISFLLKFPNYIDPDQTPRSVASDLDLNQTYLPMSVFLFFFPVSALIFTVTFILLYFSPSTHLLSPSLLETTQMTHNDSLRNHAYSNI